MSSTQYASALEAEAAFYEAFEKADIDEMMAVWADDVDVVCVHPMGPRLEGRDAIEQSWRQLFEGGPGLRFEVSDCRITDSGTLSIHFVIENIDHGPGFAQRSLVIATNMYRRAEDGWRMIAHHASPGTVAPIEAVNAGDGQVLH